MVREGGSIQMGVYIEDLLGVRAKPKWRWGQRERKQTEDGEAKRVRERESLLRKTVKLSRQEQVKDNKIADIEK